MRQIQLPTRQEWSAEIQDWLRGAAGGFLFGIPLLYTMEVWWIGSYVEPPLMLVVLAITSSIVFLLNRTDGFRQSSPDSSQQAAMDSLEAIAIGVLSVTAILFLLREIDATTPLSEALGKIVLEGMPFTIGVALARSILSGMRDQRGDAESDSSGKAEKIHHLANNHHNAALADLGATLVGAIFIAFSIAPTDEVPLLAAASSPSWLLSILIASLLISYCIVFVAGFTTQEHRLQQQGAFQHPLVETVMAYLVSLIAAALMLWIFHRLSLADPWTVWLERTLILGLPATIGGAAGRLAI
ncbi:MAG: TIGR02587 family membrane protein [Elainella sp. Prado103]|jgi:putative integral membrane protein (TIGR02587 family)|nr:TIGR02587 family membrane protein [Elainella sp. Prado103]